MAATLEISYFNTFILAGGSDDTGVAEDRPGVWHVEESRIKGGFNETSVDFGVKAHLVDDEYTSRIRGNAMIHSGIFNAKTKINETNQFSIGESITKAVDIANGSIQKLYAEDTNLIIFQENKVSRAVIDKDVIYTQEGQPLTTASQLVIGQVQAFTGKYGISKNPESFAVYGNRKYFTDKNRGLVLRLSQDGITPISDSGMRTFFREGLNKSHVAYGMYDEQKNKYIVSLQMSANRDNYLKVNRRAINVGGVLDSKDNYSTLSFDESSSGWVSFYTYKPSFGFSLNNKFYTFNQQNLWEHYSRNVQRCAFYGRKPDPADIEFVLNDQPNIIKNFLTIDYEGTENWEMESATTDHETAYPILRSSLSYTASSIPIKFINKENKYHGYIRSNTTNTSAGQVVGMSLSGIKGYYNKIKMQYWNPTEEIARLVNKAELFAVSGETVFSSQ
tara:strand:+ start:1875 stop:3215 length:1341 start_codon:yes stop_codon:yes gene_type:complete